MNQIICGDSLEVLKGFSDESIDLIVTDPPYGYSFMGKDWDQAVPSVDVWKECFRVLKSGAFAFVMSSPRQDVLSQMIVRLGLAGFETGFSSIYWAYASGFPKAMNVSKAVDKRQGVHSPILVPTKKGNRKFDRGTTYSTDTHTGFRDVSEVQSEEAKVLDGSYGGFQPKPAVEIVIVCMKPLSEKTFVDQALKNGKGVSWLDDARIPFQNSTDKEATDRVNTVDSFQHKESQGIYGKYAADPSPYDLGEGRFPANLLVSDDVLNDGTNHVSGEKKSTHRLSKDANGNIPKNIYGEYKRIPFTDMAREEGSFSRFFDLDKWFDKAIPEAVKKTFPFLICAKASKSERNQGLDGYSEKEGNRPNSPDPTGKFPDHDHRVTMNKHPTVKPLKLMSYLVTLGSRTNDVVLDPFVGSGTTCLAAEILNRKWIGIDNNPQYCEIARKRLATVPAKLEQFSKSL